MYSKETTACFTGKRPQKLPWRFNETDPRCVRLKEALRREIVKAIERGYVHFISGMALGADTFAAECVLSLKKDYPHITLEAAVPCRFQAAKWNDADKARYVSLLARCDAVNVLQEAYTATCMQERNRYMVDKSSLLIAVYDGSGGGTGSTVKYAGSVGCQTVILPPDPAQKA